jgi:hypothetical protein
VPPGTDAGRASNGGQQPQPQQRQRQPLISYSGNLFVWPNLVGDVEVGPLVPVNPDQPDPVEVKSFAWMGQRGVV